jgi:uncharacterized protein (TIGR02757 family)
MMVDIEIKGLLEEKVIQYNNPEFIESDPIQIPHQYSLKEDIEIAGFLTATISWGNRKMIIRNAKNMMNIMGNSPYDFVMQNNHDQINRYVHRTFNEIDLNFFVRSLSNIYKKHHGLEQVFLKHAETHSLQNSIHEFKQIFFEIEHPLRSKKHISDPQKGSAAKRINI